MGIYRIEIIQYIIKIIFFEMKKKKNNKYEYII